MKGIRRRLSIICLFVLVAFNLVSYGEDVQKFAMRNNDAVVVTVSEKELSRFIFRGDKIKKIFAISGELHYEIDGGNLYIKPGVQKPINFFVSMESGNTYKIIATSKDIPAVQISITISGNHKVQKAKGGVTGENVYRKKILKIIKVARAGDESVGYKVKWIGRFKKSRGGIKDYLDSKWWDDEVIAERHIISNGTKESIRINKNDYLDDKTEAVYIDLEVIEPGQEATLIKVRRL